MAREPMNITAKIDSAVQSAEKAYRLFQEEDGTPLLRDSAVLYLDLLGTGDIRDPVVSQERLVHSKKALAFARAAGGSEADDRHISVASWFSDNLGLAYPCSSHLDSAQALGLTVDAAANHQLSLAYDGLFSRGGIAFGPFYADTDFIYGPALIQAVDLEHCAKWPRVVVEPSALALARGSLVKEEGGSITSPWRSQLLVDGEGVTFVNYLDGLEFFVGELDQSLAALSRHANHIRQNLAEHADRENVYLKYRWLADYHDHFLGRFDGLHDVGELFVRAGDALATFAPFAEEIPVPEEDAEEWGIG